MKRSAEIIQELGEVGELRVHHGPVERRGRSIHRAGYRLKKREDAGDAGSAQAYWHWRNRSIEQGHYRPAKRCLHIDLRQRLNFSPAVRPAIWTRYTIVVERRAEGDVWTRSRREVRGGAAARFTKLEQGGGCCDKRSSAASLRWKLLRVRSRRSIGQGVARLNGNRDSSALSGVMDQAHTRGIYRVLEQARGRHRCAQDAVNGAGGTMRAKPC